MIPIPYFLIGVRTRTSEAQAVLRIRLELCDRLPVIPFDFFVRNQSTNTIFGLLLNGILIYRVGKRCVMVSTTESRGNVASDP